MKTDQQTLDQLRSAAWQKYNETTSPSYQEYLAAENAQVAAAEPMVIGGLANEIYNESRKLQARTMPAVREAIAKFDAIHKAAYRELAAELNRIESLEKRERNMNCQKKIIDKCPKCGGREWDTADECGTTTHMCEHCDYEYQLPANCRELAEQEVDEMDDNEN